MTKLIPINVHIFMYKYLVHMYLYLSYSNNVVIRKQIRVIDQLTIATVIIVNIGKENILVSFTS